MFISCFEQLCLSQSCLLQLWLVSSSGIWHRRHWTNTPGSWSECDGVGLQCWIQQHLKTYQSDFVCSKWPVLTCHINLPCHFFSCRMQIQMSQFNTGFVQFERSVSCFGFCPVTLRDARLLPLNVYWCWRHSVSALHSSITSNTEHLHSRPICSLQHHLCGHILSSYHIPISLLGDSFDKTPVLITGAPVFALLDAPIVDKTWWSAHFPVQMC